jgi:membrane protein DedA with SNARE-associated domain
MPAAGYSAARGELNIWLVWLAGLIGTVLGAVVLYYIGMYVGDPVVRAFLRRWGKWFTVSEKDYDRALAFFGKYGMPVIFFGRLIPIIRSIISIPAGAERMPMGQFLLFTTLGSAIWGGVLTYAGYLLGENWEQILEITDRYQTITVIVLGILFVALVAWWLLRGRKQSQTLDEVSPQGEVQQ